MSTQPNLEKLIDCPNIYAPHVHIRDCKKVNSTHDIHVILYAPEGRTYCIDVLTDMQNFHGLWFLMVAIKDQSQDPPPGNVNLIAYHLYASCILSGEVPGVYVYWPDDPGPHGDRRGTVAIPDSSGM